MSLIVILLVFAVFVTWTIVWRKTVLPNVGATLSFSKSSIAYGESMELVVAVENPVMLPAPFVQCQVFLPEGLSSAQPSPDGMPVRSETDELGGSDRVNDPRQVLPDDRGRRLGLSFSLKPREHVDVRFTVYGAKRGRFRINDVSLTLSNGLSTDRQSITIMADIACTVHPRYDILDRARMQAMRLGTMSTARKLFATSLDWIDMRPYQMGDAMRDISWMMSAKRGELIVLERSLAISHEWILVLNVQMSEDQWYHTIPNVVERVYEAGMSLACTLLQDEASVSLYANSSWPKRTGRKDHRVWSVSGPAAPRIIHGIGHSLGELPLYPHVPFVNLLQELTATHLPPSHMIVITAMETKAIRSGLDKLTRQGHRVVPLFIPQEPDVLWSEQLQSMVKQVTVS